MLHIKSLQEGLDIFKALGSDIRIEIIQLLLTNQSMNMNELASSLKITNGALTSHIKKLEECGIVKIVNESASHGNQKICTVNLDKILVDFQSATCVQNLYQTELLVGQYSDYQVMPTCGLATPNQLVGEVDNPRYFTHPDRYHANILWFTEGFVEYIIPNFIPPSQKIDEIMITAEFSSEVPSYNNIWPSDIHFYFNDTFVGYWTSPGDFGDRKGLLTPNWWPDVWNQYGVLKLLVINYEGTFIDGTKISDVSLHDFHFDYRSQIKFKIAVPQEAAHKGGLTIYGKNFGNYNQNINVSIKYSPILNTQA